MTRPLWFRSKRYGYGWYPATWQGWLVLAIWLALLLIAIPIVKTNPLRFVLHVFIITALLIIVCAMTGEKPRWLWGN